jgi:hypothetical protein
MDERVIYRTRFINDREIPVQVREYGKQLIEIAPGKSALIDQWWPLTTYARFSEVRFKEDKIVVKLNSDWKVPEEWAGRWLVELENIDGADCESIRDSTFSDSPIECYKGIPRLIAVTLDSPFIKFEKVQWRTFKERRISKQNPKYAMWVTELRLVKTERPKSELKKIEKAFQTRAEEAAKAQAKRQLKERGLESVSE